MRKSKHTYAVRFSHCNMNGLSGKLLCLQDTLDLNNTTDILLISETHLTPAISDAAVQIPGYAILRNDSGCKSIHGVCAYIASNVKFDMIDTSFSNVLSFRLVEFNVFVYAVYRLPSLTSSENAALISFLQESCADKETVMIGDFNLPSLNWASSEDMLRDATAADVRFLDLFDSLGLTHWVTDSTFPRSGNILDLILTSEKDRLSEVSIRPPPPGSDHSSIHCQDLFDTDLQQRTMAAPRFLWHRGRYDTIGNVLGEVDWDFEFRFLTAQEAYTHLLSILKPLISRYVPTKTEGQLNKLPWKTNPPTSLKRKRSSTWSAYKDAKRSLGKRAPATQESLKAFQSANKELRSFAARSQIEYEKSLLLRLKDNPKMLHSYLRHKKKFRSSVGPLKLSSGSMTDDPALMANIFALAFAGVFASSEPPNPSPHQRCDAVLEDIAFTPADVQRVLRNLDANSSMGPDGIHPHLLKACSTSLAYPLCVIFHLTLATEITDPSAFCQFLRSVSNASSSMDCTHIYWRTVCSMTPNLASGRAALPKTNFS